jgi:hypothetical protein
MERRELKTMMQLKCHPGVYILFLFRFVNFNSNLTKHFIQHFLPEESLFSHHCGQHLEDPHPVLFLAG